MGARERIVRHGSFLQSPGGSAFWRAEGMGRGGRGSGPVNQEPISPASATSEGGGGVVRNADPAGKPGFWTVTNGLLTILGFVLALGTVIIKGAVEDARVSTEKQIAAVDSRVSEHHEASEKASDKLDRGLQELSDRLSNMEGVERERGRTFDRVNQFLDRGDRMKEALDGAERRINEFGQQLETQRADALRVRTTTLQTVEKVEMALKQLGEQETHGCRGVRAGGSYVGSR